MEADTWGRMRVTQDLVATQPQISTQPPLPRTEPTLPVGCEKPSTALGDEVHKMHHDDPVGNATECHLCFGWCGILSCRPSCIYAKQDGGIEQHLFANSMFI
ncbi:unnamed protein product [Gadus morhua 'NCC']